MRRFLVGLVFGILSFAQQVVVPMPPGATNPAVTQETIKTTICVSGFTTTIRPPSGIMSAQKRASAKKLGIKDLSLGEWDHLISLQLGGAPNSPDNLWFQYYLPKPGAREKDVVEGYLKRQVCSNKITLAEAQFEIVHNWLEIYNQNYANKKKK